MVLKSPVKISTAVLGHKEKFLGVIGLLAGRIQRLFISFSLKKKKKTCNYCILTPKQAITSQKLSPGNQTLAWLIRLTSLANHSYHCAHGSLGPGWLPLGPGPAAEQAGGGTALRRVVCFYCLLLCVPWSSVPFPRDRLSSKRKGARQTDLLYCTRRRKLEKRKKKGKQLKL